MPTTINIRADATALQKGLAATLLIVGVVGLLLWNWAMRSVASFPGPGIATLAAGPAGAYTSSFEEMARRALAATPLDQRRLNALYVFETRRDPRSAASRRLADLLAKTGWRDTAAQQNLLSAAAAKGELAEVVARADGLLRRKRLEPAMFDLLHLVEADPVGRVLLLRALDRWPVWRTEFFSDKGELADARQLQARTATIALMLDRGRRLEGREVAPAIQRLIAGRQLDSAYALWLQSRHMPRSTTGLLDIDFRYAAQQWERGDRGSVPFEWQFAQDSGFETTVERTGASSEVRITWDGSGAPIFLRQRFKIMPGRPYAVRIKGLDAKPELLRNLVFMAECPGQFVTFDRPESAQPGGLSLAGDQQINCAYPELRVAAQLRESHTGFELSLSSIALEPARDMPM